MIIKQIIHYQYIAGLSLNKLYIINILGDNGFVPLMKDDNLLVIIIGYHQNTHPNQMNSTGYLSKEQAPVQGGPSRFLVLHPAVCSFPQQPFHNLQLPARCSNVQQGPPVQVGDVEGIATVGGDEGLDLVYRAARDDCRHFRAVLLRAAALGALPFNLLIHLNVLNYSLLLINSTSSFEMMY